MSTLIATRSSQRLQVASFTWNFDDTMLNTAGVSKDFGLLNTSATSFDVINLPRGAIVTGGQLMVHTAFDTASYAVIIGDSSTANRFLATADRKAVATTALVPTSFRNTTGLNIRMEITNADVCTTGKATLIVQFVVEGKADEVYPN